MTEQEWLECVDPRSMLDSLRGWASDRKLRLFAVACSRRIWYLVEDEPNKNAIVIAEQYADEKCSAEDLQIANRKAHRQVKDVSYGDAYWADPACMVTHEDPWEAARCITSVMTYHMKPELKRSRLEQAAIIRCVFGNPFRPVALDPAWLTPDVTALAQAIYDERRFADLPILADALEEAGCNSEAMLSHCRDGGEHARSCWVVDLLLARE